MTTERYGAIRFCGPSHRMEMPHPEGPGVPWTVCECGASMRVHAIDAGAWVTMCARRHPMMAGVMAKSAMDRLDAAAGRVGEQL